MSIQLAEVATHSDNLVHARCWMEKICGPHELESLSRASDLDFYYQARRLPGFSSLFGQISYGSAVSIGVDGRNGLQAFSISLPLQGRQHLITPGHRFESDAEHGLILAPDTFQQLYMDADCLKQQLVIPASAVQQVASDMLGAPMLEAVQLDPAMDMRSPAITSWWQLVQQVMGEASAIRHLYGHNLLARDLETVLIKGLLLAQPGNCRDRLQQPFANNQPAYLQRACRYLKLHAREEVSVDTLAAVAGVSRFKLFAAFRDHLQTTPMNWARNLRLDAVREDLLAASDRRRLSVSAVALDWGFSHLGRFSSQYRERFGELPSATLERAAALSPYQRL